MKVRRKSPRKSLRKSPRKKSLRSPRRVRRSVKGGMHGAKCPCEACKRRY